MAISHESQEEAQRHVLEKLTEQQGPWMVALFIFDQATNDISIQTTTWKYPTIAFPASSELLGTHLEGLLKPPATPPPLKLASFLQQQRGQRLEVEEQAEVQERMGGGNNDEPS